jgi:DNA-binding NarL/FixJ family response regulator
MTAHSTRIAVQSRRRLVRDALCAYFASSRDFLVVGQAGGVDALAELCALRRPDIVLVDTEPLSPGTLSALRGLCQEFPTVQLIVTYAQAEPETLDAAVRAGVSALVPCSAGLAGLMRELRGYPGARGRASRDGASLTDRELEIVSLLGSGHSVPEMAHLLRISPHTVENHKRHIYVKLGVGNQIHAVSRATSLGLVAPGPTGTPPRRAGVEPGRPELAVLAGTPGPLLDEVTGVLVGRGLPILYVRAPDDLGREHSALWHLGPLAVVLVEPGPVDWAVADTWASPTVLVCPAEPDLALIVDALLRGAQALIRGADVADQLVPVLALVARGYVTLPSGHLGELIDLLGVRGGARNGNGVPVLTRRERDILASIALGHTVRQSARALGIAVKTVENTQARLFQKLGVHNRSGALTIAYRLGLIDPSAGLPSSGVASLEPDEFVYLPER